MGRDGAEAYDAVTVRAVASLPVLAEYAAPLLRAGGVLVAWKGARDAAEEERGAVAAAGVGHWPADRDRGQPFERRPQPSSARIHKRAQLRRASRAAPGWPASGRWPDGRGLAGLLRSGPNGTAEERFRPLPLLPSRASHGKRLRNRQPEGRGREDHHRRQRRGEHRRGGLRDAAGRSRRPVQRHRRAGAAQGLEPEHLLLPRRAACRSRAPRLPTAIERLHAVPSTPDLAGANMELPRIAGSETRLREALGGHPRPLPVHAARLPAFARARSRSTRWSPPTRSSCPCRPSTSRSRASPGCSTRCR